MTCNELAELLPDLVDGTLVSPLLEEAETALQVCPECEKELRVVRQVKKLLATLQADKLFVEPSRDFVGKLLLKIRQHKVTFELMDLNGYPSEEIWLKLQRFLEEN